MATVLSSQKSTYGGPYAFYTVDLTYSNRTETSVTINYTITSNLQYAASYFGYSLTAYLTVAGVSSGAIALKGTEMCLLFISKTEKKYTNSVYYYNILIYIFLTLAYYLQFFS